MDGKVEVRLTGIGFLLAEGSLESFDSALEVVAFLFEVLDSLVALCKQRLESADLSEKAATNLKSEFCGVCVCVNSEKCKRLSKND